MAPPILPLRAAIIGLSSSATTSWASTAHLPGLLSAPGRSKITIKALLNSSVDAAHSAIQTYNLPPDTKAYGSPNDLAADHDIDLVICNTRVDKHYETIIPSIRAGKDVYVEWPIASKIEDIEEIVATAEESGSRVAVGLQGRWVPAVAKLREVIDGGKGRLGRVLSADVKAFGGTIYRDSVPPGLKYFAEKEVGGNVVTIGFGHVFDFAQSVIGDVDPSTVHAKTQLQRPTVRVKNPSTGQIVENITSNVPDLLSLHGALAPSPQSAPNATLSFTFRRGPPFPGTPALIWTINCEFGEIRVVSQTGLALQASAHDDSVTIQVHHFDTNEVEDLKWAWNERQKELPLLARGVSESLYAFAEGREEGDGWAGAESAAKRARLIDGFLNRT